VYCLRQGPSSRHVPDVLQLNAFQPAGSGRRLSRRFRDRRTMRQHPVRTMAMLLLNNIFERTWGAEQEQAGQRLLGRESSLQSGRSIGSSSSSPRHTGTGMGTAATGVRSLLRQELYDRMEHGNAEAVRQHLLADTAYQKGMVRSSRTTTSPGLPPHSRTEKGALQQSRPHAHRASCSMRGNSKEGKVSCRLSGPSPAEHVDPDLAAFYGRLLKETGRDVFRNAHGAFCERSAGRQPELH